MIKKNSRGFTLLELLVAIFIFTTIIFIGYKIVNKITVSVKNQGKTNNGQLVMNDLNKYLTNDLEKATSIKLTLDSQIIADTSKTDDSGEGYLQKKLKDGNDNVLKKYESSSEVQYEYMIRNSDSDQNNYPTYVVKLNKKDNIGTYSIYRNDKQSNIEFLSNIKFDNDDVEELSLPFAIEGANLYTAKMGYDMGKGNLDSNFVYHEFTVTSRLNNVALENPGPNPDPEPTPPEDLNPPIIDAGFDKSNLACIGFWAADLNKKKVDNLYVWHKMFNKLKDNDKDYGTYVNISNGNEYNISSVATVGTGQSDDYATIKPVIGSIANDAKVNNNFGNGELKVKQDLGIQVFVSEGAELDLTLYYGNNDNKFNLLYENKKFPQNANPSNVVKISENVNRLKLDGVLSLKQGATSGYAIVVYGSCEK